MTTTHPPALLRDVFARLRFALASKAAPAVLPGLRRRAEAEIERAAARAFRALSTAIDERKLRAALRTGDVEAVMREIPIDEVLAPRLRGDVNAVVREAFIAAGERTTARLKASLVQKDVSYRVRVQQHRFDVIDRRGLDALIEHGAELVTELTTSSKYALHEALVQMFADGVPVTSQVKRIQQYVGLRSDQIAAVERRRALWTAQGLSPEKVERKVQAYAREAHRYRAQTIARYETGWATNAGQQEAFRQALDDDIVTEDAKRVWRTAGDEVVRDEHAEMEGVAVGINEPFTLPDGSQVMFPPTDPGCRCAVDIEA